MRGAEIDQARFFTAADDFDREAQRLLGRRQEVRRILGDAQRVGGDGAHRVGLETAQALAEAAQGKQGALARSGIEALVGGEARGQPNRLLQ